MTLRKYSNDEPEPPKDAEIERWFQALGEPPEAQEPPGARLRMLAQIEQRKHRWWGISWLPNLAAPSLAVGLAAGLLLALAFNLWQGTLPFGPSGQSPQQVAASRTGLPPQIRMQPSDQLVATLAARIPDRAIVPVIGFMPHAQRTIFFRIGRLYAAALTALHSSTTDTANQYLTWLTQALQTVQAPDALSQYIDVIQVQLREKPDQSEQWQYILAGFEPFYHDAYTTTSPSVASLLFELGAWSENLYLAAATGDVEGVKQGRTTQDVQRALEPLNLPPEYQALLDQLLGHIANPDLSAADLPLIRSQVQTLQDFLGQ